jgi:ABC-2 type transport system ATP-binding protein
VDTPAIVCEDLGKRYGTVTALNGFDLVAPQGAIHGLLGPNGAGKTTAVRILTTLLRPGAGRAEVAGVDVIRDPARVRARIGLAGQHAAVDEILSGRQNLVMFGRLSHLPARAARQRADELLGQFGLAEAGGKPAGQYSGGMRRRLDLAASFIVAPRVLFLDEPTTGLDPHGRNEVWQSVRALAAAGTTVLLTTQYLEEADQLADAVSVIAAGRVIASGTPGELKSRAGGDRIDVVLRAAGDLVPAARLLRARLGTEVTADRDRRELSAPVTDRLAALTQIIGSLREENITVEDITVRRPDVLPQPRGRHRGADPRVSRRVPRQPVRGHLHHARLARGHRPVEPAVLHRLGRPPAAWRPHRGSSLLDHRPRCPDGRRLAAAAHRRLLPAVPAPLPAPGSLRGFLMAGDSFPAPGGLHCRRLWRTSRREAARCRVSSPRRSGGAGRRPGGPWCSRAPEADDAIGRMAGWVRPRLGL